jgi:ADP-ribose pyrophosphatase
MLASGVSSAGLTDELITLFRAEGLTKISDGGGDEHEDIRVHEVALGDVSRWLEHQVKDGLLVDLKVYSALHFATQPARG